MDSTNWELLRECVVAAHQGDGERHVAALLRLEQDLPVDIRAGVYLFFLLRYRVAVLIGRKPGPEDLHVLAQRFGPSFAKLIRNDQSELEDTLLSVFDFAPHNEKIKGGKAIVFGSAALGVLLDSAEDELAEMRPHLANWWKRISNSFPQDVR